MAGENYIGSVISLISLSDIRYIGTLHSINTQDSTVGLKQVRSYGTEGRRGKPEEEILPSDNVFDYVVFRGSDIKDLQVFEAPKPAFPQPQTNLPQDPAIMNMGYAPPVNPYNNMYAPPQKSSNNTASTNYWQQSAPAPAMPSAASLEAEERAKQEKEALDGLKAELEEAEQPTINEAAIEELAKKVSELNPLEDKTKMTSPPSRRNNNNNNNNNSHEYRGRGGRFNNNNNNNRQFNSNKKEFSVPDSEFDFEASNAKFDKSEIKKDDEEDSENEIEIPEPEEFYDKKSSFFDNISCESKERIEQLNEPRRNRFHEERKLNMETFGQATIDQSRYRNNFRGRGNSGYRNNRGGHYRNNNRGYNNNNNNNNSNNNNNINYRHNNKSQQQDQ